MENLVIVFKNKLINNRKLGFLWIILGILIFFFQKNSSGQHELGIALVFLLIGVIHLTPLVGSEKAQIEIFNGGLKILWLHWIRKTTVLDSEIESIILAEKGVIINRKNKKALKIKFYLMNRAQMTQVYDFFTEYAKTKNLVQE